MSKDEIPRFEQENDETLADTDEPDKQFTAQGEARLRRARSFLDNVLVPAVHQQTDITLDDFNWLMARFREEHPDPGADFESGHVWGVAFEQVLLNNYLAKEKPGEISPDAVLIKQVWELLSRLEIEG